MGNSEFDFTIRAVAVAVRRTPIATPVRTSFGVMRDRPAVFLRVTDGAGRHGYAEVWCNFPTVAAEHRARLASDVVGPLLQTLPPAPDGRIFATLMERLHVLAIQSGEWGPLRQVSAGFDAAVHDLAARRAGVPLYRFLGGTDARPCIQVYASGIGPERPASAAAEAIHAGHTAFKIKLGFGHDTDLASLATMRRAIGSGGSLLADANQAWTLNDALTSCSDYAEFDLGWLEEPLRADRPLEEWQQLASHAPCPLAAGENIASLAGFEALLNGRVLGFVQPDLAKWGGISGCLAVARLAAAQRATYCPHFLGSGIGLLASAHVLAAAAGDGKLEMDVNPNPLRDDLTENLLTAADGSVTLSDGPGLGVSPDHLFD